MNSLLSLVSLPLHSLRPFKCNLIIRSKVRWKFNLEESKILQFRRIQNPSASVRFLWCTLPSLQTSAKRIYGAQNWNEARASWSVTITQMSWSNLVNVFLVIRENLTSFTDSMIVKNQTRPCLKEGLVILTSRLKLGSIVYLRVDGHSSLNKS